MITPCINICKIKKGKCIGCGRTSKEISDWSQYSDEKRFEIMDRLIKEKTNK